MTEYRKHFEPLQITPADGQFVAVFQDDEGKFTTEPIVAFALCRVTYIHTKTCAEGDRWRELCAMMSRPWDSGITIANERSRYAGVIPHDAKPEDFCECQNGGN